jgi:hypothetical protein
MHLFDFDFIAEFSAMAGAATGTGTAALFASSVFGYCCVFLQQQHILVSEKTSFMCKGRLLKKIVSSTACSNSTSLMLSMYILSIMPRTWNATKKVIVASTDVRVADMNRFIHSAVKPPVACKNPHRKGTQGDLNSSGCVFKY